LTIITLSFVIRQRENDDGMRFYGLSSMSLPLSARCEITNSEVS